MSHTPQRPPPGRRRPLTSPLLVMMVIALTIPFAAAYDISFDNGVYNSIHYRELESRGEIHFDTSPLPELARRQIGQDSSSSASSSSTSSAIISTISHTASPTTSPTSFSNATTTTSSATIPSTTVVTTPLPVPFDTSLGNNFTASSCPAFFTTFLSNATFRACSPISLLLQNSASFFRAARSPSLLTETLDTACAAPLSVCTPLMSYFAQALLSDSNCGNDFRDQQPLVQQAYNGLVAYEPVYRATCLKDAHSNGYCYANAVTNASNPGDAYPYYTAIGINLPVTAKPTCSDCLQRTMAVFAQYAVRKEQPLSQTYLQCATQIDDGCGSGFADLTIKVGSQNSGMGQQASSMKNGAAGRWVGGWSGWSGIAGVVALALLVMC